MKTEKLFNLPRNTRIKVGLKELLFHHLDGAYSYCTDDEGQPYHLHAATRVEVLEGDDAARQHEA